MKVTAKSDYALRALVELSSRSDGSPVSAEEIGRAQDIPTNFLQAILADLRKAEFVHSQRGVAGGWRLAKPAEEITVADVIRAVDGPLVSVHGIRPESVEYNERAEPLQLVWIAARATLREVLENVTIGQIAAGDLPTVVESRTQSKTAWAPGTMPR